MPRSGRSGLMLVGLIICSMIKDAPINRYVKAVIPYRRRCSPDRRCIRLISAEFERCRYSGIDRRQ